MKSIAYIGTSHGIKFEKFFSSSQVPIKYSLNQSQSVWLESFNNGNVRLLNGNLHIDDDYVDLTTLDTFMVVDLGFQYRMIESYLINSNYWPESLSHINPSLFTPISDKYALDFAKECSGFSSRFDDDNITQGLGVLIKNIAHYVPVILVPAYFGGDNTSKQDNPEHYQVRKLINTYLFDTYSAALDAIFDECNVMVIKPQLDWLAENLSMPAKYWANDLGNLKGNMSHQNEAFAKIIYEQIQDCWDIPVTKK